eukprot:403340572
MNQTQQYYDKIKSDDYILELPDIDSEPPSLSKFKQHQQQYNKYKQLNEQNTINANSQKKHRSLSKRKEIESENKRMGTRIMQIMLSESKIKRQLQNEIEKHQVYHSQLRNQQLKLRQSKWENIMTDNFKLLERLNKQRSSLEGVSYKNRENSFTKQQNHQRYASVDAYNYKDIEDTQDGQQLRIVKQNQSSKKQHSNSLQQLPFIKKQDFNKRIEFDFQENSNYQQQLEQFEEQQQVKRQPRYIDNLNSSREYKKKFEQVKNLPEKRKILINKQLVIPGNMAIWLVELSRTKLKFLITAVKVNNPHKYQIIELFRKQGEKLLRSLDNNFDHLINQLEFFDGKKLIIKDLDYLLNYSPDYQNADSERQLNQKFQQIASNNHQFTPRKIKINRSQLALKVITQQQKQINDKVQSEKYLNNQIIHQPLNSNINGFNTINIEDDIGNFQDNIQEYLDRNKLIQKLKTTIDQQQQKQQVHIKKSQLQNMVLSPKNSNQQLLLISNNKLSQKVNNINNTREQVKQKREMIDISEKSNDQESISVSLRLQSQRQSLVEDSFIGGIDNQNRDIDDEPQFPIKQ